MNNTELKNHANTIALKNGIILIKSKIMLLEAGQDKQNGITYLLFSHYNRTYRIDGSLFSDITIEGKEYCFN